MYLVVGTKACTVWYAICCKIAAGCCGWLLLQQLATGLSHVFAESQPIHVYAELPGMHASVFLLATILPTLIVTSYRPDIVIYNESTNSVALLELTCTLDLFIIWKGS